MKPPSAAWIRNFLARSKSLSCKSEFRAISSSSLAYGVKATTLQTSLWLFRSQKLFFIILYFRDNFFSIKYPKSMVMLCHSFFSFLDFRNSFFDNLLFFFSWSDYFLEVAFAIIEFSFSCCCTISSREAYFSFQFIILGFSSINFVIFVKKSCVHDSLFLLTQFWLML